jgi:polysaccharide pyruvyl transferase WcaK-like protein
MKTLTRIIIVGYYNHDNLGDEQYKETFLYMLDKYLPLKRNYTIQFIDCDLLSTITIIDTDIILLGGGDILNYYFIDKVYDVFHNKSNKVIAVSVGLPYSDILMHTNKLNIIDYIFIRTKRDIKLFSRYFLKERIIYLPDISFYISKSSVSKKNNILILNSTQSKYKDVLTRLKIQESKSKIIVFSLSRHIYDKQNPEYYQNIIHEISIFILFLIKNGYFILLLPFNTSNSIPERDQNLENDVFIHEDILNIIQHKFSHNLDNILNIDFTLSTKEVLQIYEYVYVSIPMRFHACLFSIYKRIPILPIFTQKKIRNLLLDMNWQHHYELPKNNKDVPITICQKTLQEKFQYLLVHYHSTRELLNITCNDIFETNLQKSVPKLMETIQSDYPKINTVVHLCDNKVLQIYNKLQSIVQIHGYHDFRCVDDSDLKQKLVNVVNFFITGDFDSCYSYGLMEKMFHSTFDYSEEWKWIIQDWQDKTDNNSEEEHYSNPNGLFNIHYIPQADKSGAHRSGWQFVYSEIAKLHNDNSTLYLDLYLDRTFHWKKDILKMVDIIPYHNPWVGFIHHTFDETFSTYNNAVMFQDPDFNTSLLCCKGIFVLSEYLKKEIEDVFNKRNLKIPIYVFTHPTETKNIPEFTLPKFYDNPDKKIVHVGGWLRNIFSFYQLYIPTEITFSNPSLKNKNKNTIHSLFCSFVSFFSETPRHTLRKVALKGKGMNNYFPSDELFPFNQKQKNLFLDSEIHKNCSQNNSEFKNNWHRHLYDYLRRICNSVDIIETLTNEEYDDLLTKNIVFIQLVDASTVNTILECIVRNTPIIVNPHPAVVEMLGPDYPLYMSSSELLEKKMELKEKDIKGAYKCIKKIKKDKYEITTFIKEIEQVMKTIRSGFR